MSTAAVATVPDPAASTPPEARMIDIAELALEPGDVVERAVDAASPSYSQAGTTYTAAQDTIPVTVTVAAYEGGYQLQLAGEVTLHGPCARCLEDAHVTLKLAGNELHEPDEADEELSSQFVNTSLEIDVDAWAQSMVALEFPHRVLCQEECRGLCPNCGTNWNEAGCDCKPDTSDSRWDKLREIQFDEPDSNGVGN